MNKLGIPRNNFLGIISAILTAVLFYLALPPAGFWWLAWIAFVPLILVLHSRRPLIAFSLSYLCGLATKYLIFGWLWVLPGMDFPTFILLGLYYGIYTGLWGGTISMFPWNRSILIIAPASWVMFDYIMGNAGFLGAPWASLAHSQYLNLTLIQVSSLVGEYGVTFLVMFVNVAIAYGIIKRDWLAPGSAVVVIGLAYLYGYWELSRPVSGESVRVAIAQPAHLPATNGIKVTNDDSLEVLRRLTLEASGSHLDLIVWPESSFDRWKKEPLLISQISELVQSIQTPILLGTSESPKFASADSEKDVTGGKIYNSAFLIRSDGSVSEPYHKNVLMPFGEYIPMEDHFPWPKWMVPEVEPLTPGRGGPRLFQLNQDMFVSPIICWENVIADYVRRMGTDQPIIIAQLTNDNIFGESIESRQHNIPSVFRAVENRTPILIASNSGPSQIIDSHGRIVAEVPGLFEQGWIAAEVRVSSTRPFYSRYGDVFVLVVTIFLVLFFVGSMNSSTRKSIA